MKVVPVDRPLSSGRRCPRSGACRRTRGQTVVEYLLVVALFALAIVIGPHSPLERFFDAVGDRYERFTATISLP